MPNIILIETATARCSTALVAGDRVVSRRWSEEPRAHASMTAPFVQEMLAEQGLTVRDCDAVCVSKGPGSYTGLRVGVSTAKGLCFGAGIPLIAVSTLEVLAFQAIETGVVPEGCTHIIPMIDARRMEVYTAVCAPDGTLTGEISPVVITADSFAAERGAGPVLFIGDGAEKCRETLGGPGVHFVQTHPDAASLARPALAAYHKKRFEDTAYFEPLYLKQFIATVSRKNLF